MSDYKSKKGVEDELREVVTCSEGGGVKGHLKKTTSGAGNNSNKSDGYSIEDCFETSYSQLVHASDLAESKSNQKKYKQAIKHVDHFLVNNSSFEPNSFEELNHTDITDELLGKLATYFGTEARQQCDQNKPLLKYLSAHGYMSAFKNAYLKKFRNAKENPPFFEAARWGKYLKSIYKLKYNHAVATHTVCIRDDYFRYMMQLYKYKRAIDVHHKI